MTQPDDTDLPLTDWFGHRAIAPAPGDRRLGLSEGIAVEWKEERISAGTPDGVMARPVTQDGLDCVEVTIPKGTGWVRIAIDLPPGPEDRLTGLRILMRLLPRSGHMAQGAAQQAFLGRQGVTQLHLIEEGLARIAYAPGRWYEVTGAYIRPGGAETHAAVLNLPEDHVLTLALVETADCPVRLDPEARQNLETAGLVALRPFRGTRLTEAEARRAAAHAPVFAADASLEGTTLSGWAVTGGEAEILVRGAEAAAEPLRARTGLDTELRPGIWAQCGFEAQVASLVAEAGSPRPTCHLQSDPEAGPGPAFIDLSPRGRAAANRALPPPDRPGSGETGSFIADHRPVCVPAGQQPAVFVAPDITASDPYQQLVYQGLPDIAPLPGGIPGAVAHLGDATDDRPPALHLIALGPLLASARTAEEAMDMADDIARKLAFVVRQGGQVVWTLRAPPEGPWTEAEACLGRAVADLGGPVHLHCDSLAGPLAQAWGIDLPPSRCHVTPLGGTVGHYPDYASRSAARARLNLPGEAPLFLLFGQLGPGRDIEAAVAAFDKLRAVHPQAHLLILGNTAAGERRGRIRRRLDGLPHIRVIETRTADTSLQWFFRAADWAIMPYRAGHTPHALMTSMSFGLPVIAPMRDTIARLVPDGAGLLYDPDAPDGLEQSLFEALTLGQDAARDRGRTARDAMTARSWQPTAEALRGLFVKRIPSRVVMLDFEDRPREALLLGAAFPPDRTARTAIVILNFENCEDTARLVASLRDGTDRDFDLYIVDNCSESVTVDELVQRFGACHILRLPANLGYAAGNNAALRLISGLEYRHVLILNPDLTAPPDTLERLVAAAEAHDGPAVFGPALLRGGDPGRVASAGCYLDTAGGLRTGHMYAGELAGMLPDTPFEADFVTGAALFFSRTTLDLIGTLPEDYFLYFEESDWQIRARDSGVPSIVLPDVRLQHHKRSEPDGLPAPHFFYYYIRNFQNFARAVSPDKMAASRAQLRSNFITPWLERIRRGAPDRIARFTDLADRALADGAADRRGPVDLLAGAIVDPDLPLADLGIVAGLKVGFYTGGGASPKIAGHLHLPAGAATTGPWRLTAVMQGAILGTAEARPEKDEDEDRTGDADCLRIELPLPKDRLMPGRGQTVALYLNGRKTGSVSAYLPYPSPILEGKFVALNNHCCTGWLRNKAPSDRPVIAEIWTGGRRVGRGPADLPVNQGMCGFSIRLPRHLSDGTERVYELRAGGQAEVIAEAPLSDKVGQWPILDTPEDRIAAEMFHRQEVWFGPVDPGQTRLVRHFRAEATKAEAAVLPRHAEPVVIAMPVMHGDGAEAIRAAIDSVLAQSHANWTLRIGAGDARIAAQVAELLGPDPDPRLRLVRPPRSLFTRAEARNLALAGSTRPVIAHIDPGSTWDPRYLVLQLGALAGGARAVLCGQWLTQQVLGPDGATPTTEPIGLRWSLPTLPRLENRPAADISCLVLRRALHERLHGFDPAMPALEDWDLMLRMADIAPPDALPALLVTSDIGRAPMRLRHDLPRRQALERIAVTADRIASRFGMADRRPAPAPRHTDIAVLAPELDPGAGAGPDAAARIAQRLQDIAAALPDPDRGRLLAVLPAELAGPVRAALGDCRVPCEVIAAQTGSVQGQNSAYAALKTALDWRRDGADLMFMRLETMPQGGMLTELAVAAKRHPEAGILVPRHGVNGRDAPARQHAPGSWRERDTCIAISYRRGNLVDPALDPPGSLAELSAPDPFCLCLMPKVARAMAAEPAPEDTETDLDTLLGDGAARACLGLGRRIVYCGRARAFEMPF